MRHFAFQTAGFAILLSGCAYGVSGGELGETGYSRVVSETALPTPTEHEVAASARPYVIGPKDKLLIDVYGVDNLMNREVVTDAAGRISFPIAGTIDAAGLTPEQLSAEITSRLKARYVRDPQVTVNVVDAVSHTITVDGQVTMPGIYPILPDMTLMRAVASAHGLAEFAKLDDIVVLRSVNGQRYAGVYNLSAIRRGNYPDPAIYPNDIVVVGDSVERRRFRDILQALPAVTSPLIYLIGNN